MTRAKREGELPAAQLTREQQLQDKVDFLQAEVDRLRTLNNLRGARLGRVRRLLWSWAILPATAALRVDAARESLARAAGVEL